jgi:prepilin-type N-terminal cleavage/methylation domain-containing protein
MRRRQGFTMVELLVAMALIVLIMSILSVAFVEGLETFRQAKGVCDLQERLRTAVVPLREDLIARHLSGTDPLGNGRDPIKLSDLGPANNLTVKNGFFRIETNPSGGAAPILEGYDPDFIPSYSSIGDALLFTVNMATLQYSPRIQWLSVPFLSGGTPAIQTAMTTVTGKSIEAPRDFLDPNTPLFLSSWAEVAWFLVPMTDPVTGNQMYAAGGNTPLFTLHRRVRLLVQNNATVNGAPRETTNPNIMFYPEVSCEDDPAAMGSLYFNNSTDVVPMPAAPAAPHRGGMLMQGTTFLINRTPLGFGPEKNVPNTNNGKDFIGQDRILADVISFQVQVLPAVPTPLNGTQGFAFSAVAGGVYDTGSTPVAQQQIRAIQITIRVWDAKTEQVRQITVTQDM